MVWCLACREERGSVLAVGPRTAGGGGAGGAGTKRPILKDAEWGEMRSGWALLYSARLGKLRLLPAEVTQTVVTGTREGFWGRGTKCWDSGVACRSALSYASCALFHGSGPYDSVYPPITHSLTAPVNVTIRELKANSGVVTWDIPEGDPVIGFAITQQKKDVRMLRFIQEVNTTTRSCALWDLEQETDYIVHVQSIGTNGPSPPSQPLQFRTPAAAEATKSEDEITMEEVGQANQLRAGEIIIIVVVLIMWAGVIALFCRQYDIIKDNEPNNNKDKAKNSSECSTPEHPTGGLLRSKFPKNNNFNNNNRAPSVHIIEV
ncbi:hypothetical protein ACEWY4_005308 [Coilia grayii]|uniref:Fibronectin type-III domain-containing protein n=1 Tax=Coilia grayii TaxID=363190 RepID=A0ABD1KIC0_9TELE